jgi:hypothetical protein
MAENVRANPLEFLKGRVKLGLSSAVALLAAATILPTSTRVAAMSRSLDGRMCLKDAAARMSFITRLLVYPGQQKAGFHPAVARRQSQL